jgi:hypothetical protein
MKIMKKLIFAALAVFMLSSCVRDNFITEIKFPDSFTRFYEIHRSDWQRGNNATHGIHYYFEIREHRLTEEVFDYGAMQAFVVGSRGDREVISPLPFSDFFIDREGNRREEHYTVEFSVGRITFIMKNDIQAHLRPYFDYNEFMVRFVW